MALYYHLILMTAVGVSGDNHCFLDEDTEAQRSSNKVKFPRCMASQWLKQN